ncbi:uncharacterized protein LOC117186648 [Drosophila miranda]|uniref:uncharacterized protein LOC117186648 n=1 Tax=Drosophila miranda TaxID=7229 RepID=UPI00143F7054|nr:uncharacterized protein LOC117186648 [Drosophila miranda]
MKRGMVLPAARTPSMRLQTQRRSAAASWQRLCHQDGIHGCLIAWLQVAYTYSVHESLGQTSSNASSMDGKATICCRFKRRHKITLPRDRDDAPDRFDSIPCISSEQKTSFFHLFGFDSVSSPSSQPAGRRKTKHTPKRERERRQTKVNNKR